MVSGNITINILRYCIEIFVVRFCLFRTFKLNSTDAKLIFKYAIETKGPIVVKSKQKLDKGLFRTLENILLTNKSGLQSTVIQRTFGSTMDVKP